MKLFIYVIFCFWVLSCETMNEGSTIKKDQGKISLGSGLLYRTQESKFRYPIKSNIAFGISDNLNFGLSTVFVPDAFLSVAPYGLLNFARSGSGLVLGLEAKYVHLFEEQSIGLPFASSTTYKQLFYLVPSLALGTDVGDLHGYLGASWNLNPEIYVGTVYNFGFVRVGARASTLGGFGGHFDINYSWSIR